MIKKLTAYVMISITIISMLIGIKGKITKETTMLDMVEIFSEAIRGNDEEVKL